MPHDRADEASLPTSTARRARSSPHSKRSRPLITRTCAPTSRPTLSPSSRRWTSAQGNASTASRRSRRTCARRSNISGTVSCRCPSRSTVSATLSRRPPRRPPPAVAIDNDDFSRCPIDNVVRTRTQTDATAAALFGPLSKSILDEMRLETSAYEWDAKPLGRAGTIRFLGTPEVRRLRVRKFMLLLKDSGGRSKPLLVSSSPPTLTLTRTARRSEARPSRAASRLLEDRRIGGTFRSPRQDLSVSCDWVPFARIIDVAPDDFGIQWNPEALRDLEIERAAISQNFRDSIDPKARGVAQHLVSFKSSARR